MPGDVFFWPVCEFFFLFFLPVIIRWLFLFLFLFLFILLLPCVFEI
ncbi:hypothetical protein K7Y08_004804 [Salmonella enterica]|nr:hypothetical protein [Salmonella enterica]